VREAQALGVGIGVARGRADERPGAQVADEEVEILAAGEAEQDVERVARGDGDPIPVGIGAADDRLHGPGRVERERTRVRVAVVLLVVVDPTVGPRQGFTLRRQRRADLTGGALAVETTEGLHAQAVVRRHVAETAHDADVDRTGGLGQVPDGLHAGLGGALREDRAGGVDQGKVEIRLGGIGGELNGDEGARFDGDGVPVFGAGAEVEVLPIETDQNGRRVGGVLIARVGVFLGTGRGRRRVGGQRGGVGREFGARPAAGTAAACGQLAGRAARATGGAAGAAGAPGFATGARVGGLGGGVIGVFDAAGDGGGREGGEKQEPKGGRGRARRPAMRVFHGPLESG
jgi:hypothetical protein